MIKRVTLIYHRLYWSVMVSTITRFIFLLLLQYYAAIPNSMVSDKINCDTYISIPIHDHHFDTE